MNKFSYHSLLLVMALFTNNCSLLSAEMSSLQKTCNALGVYYDSMGRNDYYDNSGTGLFTKWFEKEEMEIEDMEEELDDENLEDCQYSEFDDNFPLNPPIDDKNVAKVKIIKIIQYCFKNGEPPKNENDDNNEVQKKADVPEKNYCVKSSGNPFHLAAQAGNFQELNRLKQSVHIKEKDKYGTALHWACKGEKDNANVVKWLLDECGFQNDINTEDSFMRSPILWAAEYGHFEIIKILIEYGADINYTNKRTERNALHFACTSKNTELVKFLIEEHGFDKNKKSLMGITPFFLAAKFGTLETLQLLFEQRVDVNVTDKIGQSALHYTCGYPEHDQPKKAEFLVKECDLSIYSQDKYNGKSPFVLAVQMAQLETIKMFVKIKPNIEDHYLLEAIQLAEESLLSNKKLKNKYKVRDFLKNFWEKRQNQAKGSNL